jgi:hypothetical protein
MDTSVAGCRVPPILGDRGSRLHPDIPDAVRVGERQALPEIHRHRPRLFHRHKAHPCPTDGGSQPALKMAKWQIVLTGHAQDVVVGERRFLVLGVSVVGVANGSLIVVPIFLSFLSNFYSVRSTSMRPILKSLSMIRFSR